MKENDDSIIIIFKLHQEKPNVFEYKFHSIASILEKDDNDFMIETGELSGFMNGDLDRIYADSYILTSNYCEPNVTINNPLGQFKPNEYAFYKVPRETWEYIKKKKFNYKESLVYLCMCSFAIKFVWVGGCNYAVIRNNKKLDLLKEKPVFLDNDIKSIINMINHNSKTSISDIPNIVIKEDENLDKSEKFTDIDLNSTISDFKKRFVKQDEAIESILSNVYANQILLDTKDEDLISTQKTSILIEGPTGTGKTAIMSEAAKRFGLPFVIANCTAYSSTGYVGSSLTDILVKLLHAANGNLELAERGIIDLDEFDKLAQDPKDINKLALKSAVQQELLAFIGGGKFDISYKGRNIEFDTSHITFIGSGAFTFIRDKKLEEINNSKNTIGFGNNYERSTSYEITEQDYVDYGLMRELVGRLSLLVSTKSYTVEDYKNILLNSTISPLKQFIKFVSVLGIEKVIYNDEFIESIAIKAYEMNFGVRGLQKIISNLKNLLLLNIINNEHNTIELNIDMLEEIEKKKIKSIK